jgi:transcriptional regulator with XRE-family HTH domain
MARPESPKRTTSNHFLREWRKARGLTQERLAELVELTAGAISQLERGDIQFKQATLERLGKALGCGPGDIFSMPNFTSTTLGWLPKGKHTLRFSRNYQIMGYVGAGETVELLDEAAATGFGEILLPFDFGENCAALVCRGNSIYPRVKNGEIVLYQRDGHVTEKLLGSEAIVGLDDGRVLLKNIAKGSSPHHWNLESHNFPTIYDATIEWCGEVIAIVKPRAVL